jgi:flagellar protein FliO/FliZ
MYEDFGSVLLATLGIVTLILLTYFAGKWYTRSMGIAASGAHIRILDRVMLGRSSSILIIDIDGTQYLIGAGDQRIEILKEFDQPVVIDTGITASNKFKEYMRSYLSKGKDS